MAKDDGGPAFPSDVVTIDLEGKYHEGLGMSLRDWFAGQALNGIASGHLDTEYDFAGIAPSWARAAYEMADAMLAARKNSRD